MKDELIRRAGFSNTFEKDRLHKLIELVVEECLDLVHQTPKNCALSSYDTSVVECTIQKSLDQITNKFNLPQKRI